MHSVQSDLGPLRDTTPAPGQYPETGTEARPVNPLVNNDVTAANLPSDRILEVQKY
jgi:hypothetical protein